MAASRVPSADMASVSSSAGHSLRRKARSVLGASISARNLPIFCHAAPLKNCRHCKSSDAKLKTASTSSAATTQQALQRALNSGGGKRFTGWVAAS